MDKSLAYARPKLEANKFRFNPSLMSAKLKHRPTHPQQVSLEKKKKKKPIIPEEGKGNALRKSACQTQDSTSNIMWAQVPAMSFDSPRRKYILA